MSPEDCATILATDVRTVLRWEREGLFPRGVRFTSRMIRYPVEAVDAWVRQHDPAFAGMAAALAAAAMVEAAA